MGYGSYSTTNRAFNSTKNGFDTITVNNAHTVFKSTSINNAMNPHGIQVRESRDSKEHPNSVAIIMALDETGSMGSVPVFLVKEGLPHIMDKIIKAGEPDPQMLFLGIGDHECDRSPLQVGQFESNDELLDKWLTDVYLEGGGGSNAGESYLLAWFFASRYTSIDCFEKRGQKGFLFTIGDEPTLKNLPAHVQKNLMGPGQYSDQSAAQLLDKAREKYHVYHIHVKETGAGSRQETIDGWKQLMGENLITVQRAQDIAAEITNTVVRVRKTEGKSQTETKTETTSEETML